MSNYRDFYIKQIEAKTLEQSNRPMEALKLYLEIIYQYSPNEDTSYREAIKILKMNDDIVKAIEICELAIKQIDAQKLESDRVFYEKQLNILKNIKSRIQEEKAEIEKLDELSLPQYWWRLLIFFVFLLIAFALSWNPTTKNILLSKFAFIIAAVSTIGFFAETIRNLVTKVFSLFPVGMLFLSIAVSMVSALFIPPPEWAVFFDVNKFLPRPQISSQNTKDKVKVITNTSPTANMTEEEKEKYHAQKNEQANAEDVDFQLDEKNLKEISNDITSKNEVDHIDIKSSSNSIYLHVKVDENLGMDEIKKKAQQCVDDFIASKSDLGNIIQKYHIYVNVNNSRDEIILYGGIKKGSTKTTINW